MVSADVAGIVGVVGSVISAGLFLSPLPIFWNIIKKKDVGEFRPDQRLATIFNCMLYGLPFVHPHSTLAITINGIELAVEAIYLGVFFFALAPGKKRLRVLVVLGAKAVLMVALVLSTLLGAAHTHDGRSMIIDILCVVANTFMYASPLTVVKKVITTKSVECMPFYYSLVGLLNGCCWTAFALIKFDLYTAFSSTLGVLFSIAQLILYACYYKSTPSKAGKYVQLHRRPQVQHLHHRRAISQVA